MQLYRTFAFVPLLVSRAPAGYTSCSNICQNRFRAAPRANHHLIFGCPGVSNIDFAHRLALGQAQATLTNKPNLWAKSRLALELA